MIPFVAGAVVLAAFFGYKKYRSGSGNNSRDDTKSLGRFAVWGQPNTGKTTFITRLRGDVPGEEKTQTTSRKVYRDIEGKTSEGVGFRIEELVDIPGSRDRLNDWLKEVKNSQNIFYVVDLSKLDDKDYCNKVQFDIKRTVEIVPEGKKVSIIGTHLDHLSWLEVAPCDANNIISDSDQMRSVYDAFGEVKGVIYSVNLKDDKSASQLIQDIVNDCIS